MAKDKILCRCLNHGGEGTLHGLYADTYGAVLKACLGLLKLRVGSPS